MKGLTKREDDYSQWYLDVIKAAEMAENSAVRGCMVIKPYGYAIWERMKEILDREIKKRGHVNAYFPLFVPKSFLSKEASHVEGFAKECAIVTHHRLKDDPVNGGVMVDPEAVLAEELIVRPTSETIIYDTYAKWVESHRDLPIMINQWANVVRWEMRTRPFLRTTEFLWQEGHTAHATEAEAEEEAMKMIEMYREFSEDYLAIPVIVGRKSESEKFAGAKHTYTIEAMMQDGKALQCGTSHNLGQNFAKAFDVKFSDKDGNVEYVWQTSWGVSTRLIGGLIMAHSDDNGLVVPPNIAAQKIVIIPITKEDNHEMVVKQAEEIKESLDDAFGMIHIDDRDYLSPGAKFHEWEKKGVPIRVEIGPKDIEAQKVVVVRRDNGDKKDVAFGDIEATLHDLMIQIQENVFAKAKLFAAERTHDVDSYDELKKIMEEKQGFVYAYWCGSEQCEQEIHDETKATIRCIPLEQKEGSGACVKCGNESMEQAVFAKAY